MKILGIETSCDETAASVVEDGHRLLSNVVASSADLHIQYGGVVPEIAARSHIEAIIPVIEQALWEAFAETGDRSAESGENSGSKLPLRTSHSALLSPQFDPWEQIDAIAVTYGAGLGGSLLIGVLTARTLAIAKHKPLYGINHVEGHVYANFLVEDATRRSQETEVRSEKGKQNSSSASSLSALPTPHFSLPATQPRFPMLALIVSGGHSQLVLFRDHFDYTLLGQTQDDAIGEAFDKVAKILGLPYPGGPSVGRKALEGNPLAFELPKAKLAGISPALAELRSVEWGEGSEKETEPQPLRTPHSALPTSRSHSYDFSFSGLKTAVLRLAQAQIGADFTFPSSKLAERLSEPQKADIAASFQRVAIETVVDKTILAYEEFQPRSVVIAGGVAASPELRRQLTTRLKTAIGYDPVANGLLQYQDPKLMTDNGAMIATLGCFKATLGQSPADPYLLAIAPNLSM